MLKTRYLKQKDRKIVLKRKHLTITLSGKTGGLDIDVFNIVNRKKYLCKITKMSERKYLKDSQFQSLFDVVRTCIEKSQFACYILREPSSVDDTLDEFMLIRIRVEEGGLGSGRKLRRRKKRKGRKPGQKYFWFVLRLRSEDDNEEPKPILKEELKPFSKALKRVRFKIPRTNDDVNFSSTSDDDLSSTTSSCSSSSPPDSQNPIHQLFKPRRTERPQSRKSGRNQPLIYPLLDDLQESSSSSSSSSSSEEDRNIEIRNSSLFENDTIRFESGESDEYDEEEEENENEYRFHYQPTYSSRKQRIEETKNRNQRTEENDKRTKEKKEEIRLSSFENEPILYDTSSSTESNNEETGEKQQQLQQPQTNQRLGIRICDVPVIPTSNFGDQRIYDLMEEAEKLVDDAVVTLTELKKGLFVM